MFEEDKTSSSFGGDYWRNTTTLEPPSDAPDGAEARPPQKPKANKNYCMLCYIEFGLSNLKGRHHCWVCGSSCCSDCSSILHKGNRRLEHRMCELCETRKDNPHLEDNYRRIVQMRA